VIERWERIVEGYVFGWLGNLLVLKRKDPFWTMNTAILDHMIKAAKEPFSAAKEPFSSGD
jgi:hypothetical protein